MNDKMQDVETRYVRFDEGSRSTVAHRNDNVIKFDLSHANILGDDPQASQ